MRKKFTKLKITLLSAAFVLFMPMNAFAASGGEIYTEFYKENAKLLVNNFVVTDALNYIGWLITKFFVTIGNISQKLYDTAFGFIDITDSEQVNSFIGNFKIVFIALSCLALCYLGIILIMQPQKKPNVAINFCFAVLCVTCSTWLFSSMNDLAYSFKGGVENLGGSTKQMAVEVVDNNMYDLLALYNEKGTALTEKNATTGAKINDKSIEYIDINETIDYKSDQLSSQENAFKYRLKSNNGKDGQPEIVEINNGYLGTPIGNDFYYRYNFEFVTAWLQLLSLILVYLTMSYKCIRVAFELVVGRLLAYLYSAELSGGEKIRKIIVFIRDSYILLAVSVICIKVYTIFTQFIGSNSNTKGLTGAFFSLFLAFAIIDGPNLVEKLLGLDAGLKSSTARMMAIGRAARGAAHGIGHGIKNVGNFGMAAATGKAAQQRKAENGNATFGEKIGRKLNEAIKGKNSDGSDPNNNVDANQNSNTPQNNEASNFDNSSNETTGNNYDFMKKNQGKDKGQRNAETFMNRKTESSKKTSVPTRETKSDSKNFDNPRKKDK